MNWLVGKNEPKFWKDYSDSFSLKPDVTRFVIFDCQKTGLDWREDRIISIGCVAIVNEKIIVNDSIEINIEYDNTNEPPKINVGSLEYGKKIILKEDEALEVILNYISNSVLVGLKTNLDIEMINQALKRNNLGKLKNMVIDLKVIYEKSKRKVLEDGINLNTLCEEFNLKPNHRLNTSGNAFLIALMFQKLKKDVHIEI